MSALDRARVLVVGAGGLGSPAAWFLAASGVVHVTLCDDDVVALDNLPRQIFFRPDDVGKSKIATLAARLAERISTVRIETRETRLVPENALELVRGHDLVLEGADNLATKFLAADACGIAGVPLVSAGVVRWSGWTLVHGKSNGAGACLRCLFEGPPEGQIETCAEAGVASPLAGTIAALAAELAVRALLGEDVSGTRYAFDALRDRAPRRSRVHARAECPLCGTHTIDDLDATRYEVASCS